MKQLLFSILALLATPVLAQQVGKVKPQQPTAPPSAQKYAITATANAAKAQALDKVVPQLSSVNNKAVTLR